MMFPILEESTIASLHKLNTIVLNPSVRWLPVLFRGLAITLIAPIIFLTALDVAAYLIARTVGVTHHRHAQLVKMPITSTTTAQKLSHQNQKPTIIISEPALELSSALSALHREQQSLNTPSSEPPSPPKFPTHFTSASEGNFALAGEGVFSPPESRAGSPSLDRQSKYRTRKRSASIGVEALGAITDSTNSEEDETESSSGASISGESPGPAGLPSAATAHLRKRKPGLQFTPLN